MYNNTDVTTRPHLRVKKIENTCNYWTSKMLRNLIFLFMFCCDFSRTIRWWWWWWWSPLEKFLCSIFLWHLNTSKRNVQKYSRFGLCNKFIDHFAVLRDYRLKVFIENFSLNFFGFKSLTLFNYIVSIQCCNEKLCICEFQFQTRRHFFSLTVFYLLCQHYFCVFLVSYQLY